MGRLFWKIFFFTLVAQVLATAGIGGALWLHNRSEERKITDVETGRIAVFMIESAAATLQHGGPAALKEMLDRPGAPRPLYAVDEQGRELLGRDVNQSLLAQARELKNQQGERQVVRELVAADGHTYLLFLPSFGRPWRGEHGVPPPGEPGAGAPAVRPHGPGGPGGPGGPHGRNPFLLVPFLTIVSAVLGSLIIAAFVAWYFSRPIRALRRAFDAAAGGQLDAQVAAGIGRRRDELADLGHDFDRMTARLRDLMEGQRRLLHDVSHELRSPLARLQAAIGLARQRPEAVESSLERIERECMRMDQLVGELLTLSRLDAGVPGKEALRREEIPLHELLDELAEDARFEARASGQAGCTVELSGELEATLHGQPELLRRAIENVLRNALRHTRPGTAVELYVARESPGGGAAGALVLSVSDRGPGVSEDELEQIFEPFVRGSASSAAVPGHGLGLAIAKRVVQAHGGQIRAFNRAGGGLTVEMRLP